MVVVSDFGSKFVVRVGSLSLKWGGGGFGVGSFLWTIGGSLETGAGVHLVFLVSRYILRKSLGVVSPLQVIIGQICERIPS